MFVHLSYPHTVTHSCTGYFVMSVRTTEQFKKIPLGKVCMVYYHAIDVVLDRGDVVRRAWQAKCHLAKAMFMDNKSKGARTTLKLRDYVLFKRMIAVKSTVYDNHKKMLRLYEKYCVEASTVPYWGECEEVEDLTKILPADPTNEPDCDDGF